MKEMITLKKLNALVVERDNFTNKTHALTFNTEMMSLGFMMSKDLFDAVCSLKQADIEVLYNKVIPVLQKMKGADVRYKPMYPQFPEQVIKMSEIDLYMNACVHYWTFGQWKPHFTDKPRQHCFELTTYRKIGLTTIEEYKNIFTKILSSGDSISAEDKGIIEWFIEHENSLTYPKSIPFKENLCVVASILKQQDKDIGPLVNSATDVLRIITYLSNGDISLSTNTRFKSLSRKERRYFIQLLESVGTEEDFNRHRNKWGKLFHNLHVGDYSDKLYKIAKKIRENRPIRTFYSHVEFALKERNYYKTIALLKKRPSEFARKVDFLMRTSPYSSKVVENFLEVIEEVPVRVLLQLLGHIQTRFSRKEKMVVFPKGNTQKAIVVRKEKDKLDTISLSKLIEGIRLSLSQRFEKRETLGSVWIDPQLKRCPVPSQMRSASTGLFTVGRGTRMALGDKGTLRFFIYWVGRDIDLSATLHDENFRSIGHVSYTQLKSQKYKAFHSGDITSAPKGASEFIDITIDGTVASGARYVVMNVLVYSGPTFAEHKKCYAGWMTRSEPNSNEIYDPKTVEQKLDLTGSSRNAIPVIFDLVKREAVWTDLYTKGRIRFGGNNVESNRASIDETLESIVTIDNKVTLYELFMLHGQARGTVIDKKEDAQTIFSMSEGVTPYDITTIHSEYTV